MKNSIFTKNHTILILTVIIAVGFGLFTGPLDAKTLKMADSEVSPKQGKIEKFFKNNSDGTDLLNILADIKNSAESNKTKEAQAKSADITNFLEQNKERFANKADAEKTYSGDRVLEIKYGDWPNYSTLDLPVALTKEQPFNFDFFNNKVALSQFSKNKISSAHLRYVSYDFNEEVRNDLDKLIISLNNRSKSEIINNVEEIYDDILIDHSSKISLVRKVRENLVVARYLIENNQYRAAENSVSLLDSLMLHLIEARSDSPIEQKRIRDLRKELSDVSKISDHNYNSKWEKIPNEIEDWWKK